MDTNNDTPLPYTRLHFHLAVVANLEQIRFTEQSLTARVAADIQRTLMDNLRYIPVTLDGIGISRPTIQLDAVPRLTPAQQIAEELVDFVGLFKAHMTAKRYLTSTSNFNGVETVANALIEKLAKLSQ